MSDSTITTPATNTQTGDTTTTTADVRTPQVGTVSPQTTTGTPTVVAVPKPAGTVTTPVTTTTPTVSTTTEVPKANLTQADIDAAVAKSLADVNKRHQEELNKIRTSQNEMMSPEESLTLKSLTQERQERVRQDTIYKTLVGKFDENVLRDGGVKVTDIPQIVTWAQSNFGLSPEVLSGCDAKGLVHYSKQYQVQKIETYQKGNVYNNIVANNEGASDAVQAQQNQIRELAMASFGKSIPKKDK